MPRYRIAFPVYNAIFEKDDLSFKVADVTFMSKTSLSKEFDCLNEKTKPFKETQIFAVVDVCERKDRAQDTAFDKCCFAADIFKICSDLYHSNIGNLKSWQFDVNKDFITNGGSECYCKELDSEKSENIIVTLKRDRFSAYILSNVLSSVNKWNIEEFESLYRTVYTSKAKSIHKVLKRACHLYSQSFSTNNLYEKVVLLCATLDTLATCELNGKVAQLRAHLPSLVLKYNRLSENLKSFIGQVYDVRSAYIHNAEETGLTARDIDILEKIVYRVVLQIIRNSSKYRSTKELCDAIKHKTFVPILDNLPDIYVPATIVSKKGEQNTEKKKTSRGVAMCIRHLCRRFRTLLTW